MEKIIYYNAKFGETSSAIADGTSIAIDALIKKSFVLEGIDPLGIKNPTKWENLVSSIIYSLTGKIPLRQEVLRGRQIMRELPRNFKERKMAYKTAFCLMPYILIGFKSHLEDRFQSDSNIVSDVVAFIVRLQSSSNPTLTSFLCAHRGRSETERHVLIDSVQIEKAKVVLNVMRGILSNSPSAKPSSIFWYQQGASQWACLNMFPEMFLRYLTAGKVSQLLDLLKKHYADLREVLAAEDTQGITSEMCGLDSITTEVLQYLKLRYGTNWQSVDFFNLLVEKDPIVRIALDTTLPVVARQMPFYSVPDGNKSYVDKKDFYIEHNVAGSQDQSLENLALVSSAIERFFELQIMHPTAKAVYETTFYYLWGRRCALNENHLAIGIDRDHASFQYLSWKEGYIEGLGYGKSTSIPMLYARRTVEDCSGSSLKDYSLRQFWR